MSRRTSKGRIDKVRRRTKDEKEEKQSSTKLHPSVLPHFTTRQVAISTSSGSRKMQQIQRKENRPIDREADRLRPQQGLHLSGKRLLESGHSLLSLSQGCPEHTRAFLLEHAQRFQTERGRRANVTLEESFKISVTDCVDGLAYVTLDILTGM